MNEGHKDQPATVPTSNALSSSPPPAVDRVFIKSPFKLPFSVGRCASSPVSGCKPRVTKSGVTALYRFHIFIFQRFSGWNFLA